MGGEGGRGRETGALPARASAQCSSCGIVPPLEFFPSFSYFEWMCVIVYTYICVEARLRKSGWG